MSAHVQARDYDDMELQLLSLADAAHVDRVEYRVSADPREAVATFRCDDFGDCVVSLVLNDNRSPTPQDLAIMARLANEELERVVCDSGYGAVFDIVRHSTGRIPPQGFKIEYRALS